MLSMGKGQYLDVEICLICFVSIWAQLFKTDDVVSYQDVGISNLLYTKSYLFLPKNVRSICSAKAPHNFSTKFYCNSFIYEYCKA